MVELLHLFAENGLTVAMQSESQGVIGERSDLMSPE